MFGFTVGILVLAPDHHFRIVLHASGRYLIRGYESLFSCVQDIVYRETYEQLRFRPPLNARN